jgi:CheY-like chemotaxis protein
MLGHGTSVKLYVPRALRDAVDLEEELDYEVLLASDARPAIPILQSDRHIDLMISDVMLPHINGRKLAEIAHLAA